MREVVSCVRRDPSTTDLTTLPDQLAPNANRILPYMIGGHPELANALLEWLWDADEYGDGTTGLDDDDIGVYDGFMHSFKRRDIVLDHNEGDLPPFTVDIRECMEYLTAGVDPWELLKIPMITDNKELLLKMVQSEKVVNIYDKETWGEDDFTPIVLLVHRRVAPHCCHQQAVENHVQAAGHVRKTNVGEERGSHRGTSLSYIMRNFNSWSVRLLRADKDTTEERKKICRAWGRARIRLFSIYTDNFTDNVDVAIAAMDEGAHQELFKYIGSDESRQSTKDTKHLIDKVKGGVGKVRKVTKSEHMGGADLTAEMDGAILFSILTKTNGHEPHVNAEIESRGLESKFSTPLNETSIKDKLKVLKEQAKMEQTVAGQSLDRPPNCIKPQSDMMKTLFPIQSRLIAEKRAKKS